MSQAITSATSPPQFVTVADVVSSVGDIPTHRIRIHPAPGTATEADVVRVNEDAFRTAICELVDGTLVEKTMGAYESHLALMLATFLNQFVLTNKLGVVLGADGMLRLAPGSIRIPDVSFLKWEQFPNKQLPRDPAWNLHPDLAVEVLSPSNTRREMQRKLHDYFTSGASLVWFLDPDAEEMHVYRSESEFDVVDRNGAVDGGDVLPGFSLPLAELFDTASPAEHE